MASITSVGIAEEVKTSDNVSGKHLIIDIKEIGDGTEKSLIDAGVDSAEGLMGSVPEHLASKIS